jgi:hypothetical protein
MHKINFYYVYTDPDLDIYISERDGVFLVLIGQVLDLLDASSTGNHCAEKLCELYQKSENSFFDYIDTLTGRFIILVTSSTDSFVFHDPAGNRALFYRISPKSIIISSHAQIIAELHEDTIPQERKAFIESQSYKGAGTKYLPGVLTPYPSILLLTPNTLLDLRRKQVRRFFPRAELRREKLTDDLIDDLAHLFSTQVRILAGRQRLAVSLTGGVDSRLTFAATKDYKQEIFYYTYVIDGDLEQQRDAQIAEQLCRRLGAEHHIISVNKSCLSGSCSEFLEVFHRNTAYMRADRQGLIANALYEQYPKDYLHIKSNVSEIGRAYYKKIYSFLPEQAQSAIFSYLYPINRVSKFCIGAFEDFTNKVDFHVGLAYGYNAYDLFYWEHRMGCWQSLQLLDFDMVQDTIILYNNRYIINKMLSVSIENRKEDILYYKLIKRLWPEALSVPVNTWQKNRLLQQTKRLMRGMNMRLMCSMYGRHGRKWFP